MRKTISLLALAGLFALSACDWGKKKEDEVLPIDNGVDEIVDNAAQDVPDAAPLPEAPLNVTNTAMPPPPPPVAEDQQTLDDADATGLTSRLPEEDVLGEAAGNAVR